MTDQDNEDDIYSSTKVFNNNLKKTREFEEDVEMFNKFVYDNQSRGVFIGKIASYLFYLTKARKLLNKPFLEATREDLLKLIAEINNLKWKNNTRNIFIIALKNLYRIWFDLPSGEYPSIVSWIKKNNRAKNRLLPDLLSNSEIKLIIDSCTNLRDKAFLSILSESGCRIGEIVKLQIKHLAFERLGNGEVCRIYLNGKTGMRRILLIDSANAIKNWLAVHPENLDPESKLWYSPQGELKSYKGFCNILSRAVKRAGINKRVYPHLFRHSRATELAKTLSDNALKSYLGWVGDSKMIETYIHLSSRDVDTELLKSHGIVPSEDERLMDLIQKQDQTIRDLKEQLKMQAVE